MTARKDNMLGEVSLPGGPSGDSLSSEATPQEQVGELGMPAVQEKR